MRRVGKLLNCCRSLRGRGRCARTSCKSGSKSVSNSVPVPGTRSYFQIAVAASACRKKAFLFARTAKKNWLVLPGEKEIRIEPMKVSRALVTLSCLAVPVAVAVEECFYLDFSLVSLGAVAEMSIYIFATVSMLPHAPPFPLCHSLFSAVQASALNLPVERHTYT